MTALGSRDHRCRATPCACCTSSASGRRSQAAGYAFNSLGLRAPDPQGTLIVEFPDVRTGGPDLPATVGMYRPDLARILTDRAREARREDPLRDHDATR